MATINQLFQFDGQLYEQTDGVAMGSSLGPLLANVFMCHLEEKLACDCLMPHLYRRYVDGNPTRMLNTDAATMFLTTLNFLHPVLTFTIELPVDDKIPFIEIIKTMLQRAYALSSSKEAFNEECAKLRSIFLAVLITRGVL